VNIRQSGEPDLLFVYGTLRRGFERHAQLERLGAQFVGMATGRAELFDLRDYPGAVPSKALRARLVGELYRLSNPARAFTQLDPVEGYDPEDPERSLFRREIGEVTRENGESALAWIYWLNRPAGRRHRIPSGDYARRSGGEALEE
jgi:gamma-glutamylcyclotransferase (GGCT)/AIG2-like uncharacterized protein YtfP